MNWSKISLSDYLVIGPLLLLVTFSSWVWGGGHPAFAELLSGVVLLAWACFLLRGVFFKETAWTKTKVMELLKDPILYLGIAGTALLLLQLNNAYVSVGEVAGEGPWYAMEGPSGSPLFCVNARDALVGLVAYFGLVTISLILRHAKLGNNALRVLLFGIVINAVLLGLFGIIQYLSGTDAMYWVYEKKRHFFAGFFYENHAGQYFYMVFALASGLLLHSLQRRGMHANPWRLIGWVLVFGVIFVSVLLSYSKTAVLAAGCLAMALALSVMVLFFRQASVTWRFYYLVFLCAGSLSAGLLINASMGQELKRDFLKKKDGQGIVGQAIDARTGQYDAAVLLFKEFPLYGIGDEGFRYFVRHYSEHKDPMMFKRASAGTIHNDYLRILCERGIIGGGIWLSLLLVLGLGAWQKIQRNPWLFGLPFSGVLMIALHALWDVPFQLPAILFVFAVSVNVINVYRYRRST